MIEEAPTSNSDQPVIQLGDTLVNDRPDIGLGSDYHTNLPANVNIFTAVETIYDNPDRRPYEGVNPGTLDELPPGKYFIIGDDPTIKDDPISETSSHVEVSLEIVAYNDGKYLSKKNQIGRIKPQCQAQARPLLEQAGFVFLDDDTLIPTPLTVQKKMREKGVEVELMENTGHIPSAEYVHSYRQGKYPIATGEESYYQHDIEDDHITGIVLGGPELMQAISVALETVITQDGTPLVSDEIIGKTANGIDRFTSALRAATAPFIDVPNDFMYSPEQARKTLREFGHAIDLTPDTVDSLLAIAQKRADSLGVQVREIK